MKLKKVVTKYVIFKKTMGVKFKTEEGIFSSFCRHVGDVHINDITARQVRSYLDGNNHISSYWKRKYTALLGLYRFSLSRSYVGTSPLPHYHPQIPPPLMPYIYSKHELKRLLSTAPVICGGRVPIEAFVLRALLLLLYGACLRHGEALRLTIGDVDLKEGILHIHESKFYKTRTCTIRQRFIESTKAI